MPWSRRWLIYSRESWLRVLGALREFGIDFESNPMELIVRETFDPPSDAQRRLFHAVCEDVGVVLGYWPGEFKEVVRSKYFGDPDEVEDLLATLRGVPTGRFSTEDLSHEYYGRLIECAYAIAADLGIVVPDRRRR